MKEIIETRELPMAGALKEATKVVPKKQFPDNYGRDDKHFAHLRKWAADRYIKHFIGNTAYDRYYGYFCGTDMNIFRVQTEKKAAKSGYGSARIDNLDELYILKTDQQWQRFHLR